MDKRIVKTLNYIEDHLSQIFNLEDLAAIACLSTSQFHRLFKCETGKTPFKFCQEIKLQFAYEKLTEGCETSIVDLSIQLGYKDYETFSRAFKKKFHLAPGDLKAIAKRVTAELKNQSIKTDGLMIATFENKHLTDENMHKIMELVKENNYSTSDLKDAHIFIVSKKGNLSVSENLVNNKFEIAEDQKLWQKLIAGV